MTETHEPTVEQQTLAPVPPPSPRVQADAIVRSHVAWATGAGLMPLPLLDLAAVTAVQLDMVRAIASVYGVAYTGHGGKAFVSALAGGTLAKIGASLMKSVPVVGSIAGGVSMSMLSGASTYGMGQVLVNHFDNGGTFDTIDFSWAKDAYAKAYEKGKEWVESLTKKEDVTKAQMVAETLEKLKKLQEQGVLTETEFQATKETLLSRL